MFDVIDERFVWTAIAGIIIANMITGMFRSRWTLALIHLPGTFLHELAHFVTAVVLNGKPSGFSLWPKRLEDGTIMLGSVTINNPTWYNAVPIALAPISLAVAAVIAPSMMPWINLGNPMHLALVAMAQGLVAHSSVPSSMDWKIIARHPMSALLYGGLAWWIWQGLQA